jgi:hypothetical protein
VVFLHPSPSIRQDTVPFMKDAPVQFSAIGGIGIFMVVFLILAVAFR